MSILASRLFRVLLDRSCRGLRGASALAIAWPVSAAPAPGDVQAVARDVIRRLDLQTEMPTVPEPASWHFELPPEFLWLAVAVGVVLASWWLYANRRRLLLLSARLRRREGAWSEPVAADDATMAAPAVLAADELARQGRFAAAMHSLLLQSLADIRARLGEHLAESLTSREILRAARVSDPVRAALREIVGRVEWTYFGEYPAGPEDYEECRRSFADLSASLGAEMRR